MGARALTLAALVALLAVTPAANAAARLVLYERDVLYDDIATHGFDVVGVRESAFKNVGVTVTVPARCAGLNGELTVTTAPPPPIPPASIVTRFTCAGASEPTVVGVPGLPAYHGNGAPLVLSFAGAGRALLRVQVTGEPWS